MKTDSRPTSSGYGRASSSGHQGESVVATTSRQQRVSSATNRVGSTTYFDIANTILGTAGDFDDLLLGAARDGDYSKIEQLLVQRSDIIVDIDCKDKRTGNTALIWAAKKGHNRIVQLLLRHGADPTLRNYEAQTALEVATGATKTMLLDSVDSGNRANECSHRLLLQAAWQGNLEVIRRLLSSSKVLDINCQNAEGLTPLMLVARDVQLFERLAVQLNRHYNPVEVAKELMRARADVHTCDNDGRSCLHFAAQTRATMAEQLVQTLLGGGSEPAQMDRRQYTAIHWASQIGNTNVVQALLDGGSEVNSRGFAGLTPLHISAHNDHHRTAVTLLQNGADVTLTDDRGLTPVDLAKTRKMKTTLKEAWTEATQNNNAPELAPVRAILSREFGSRSSIRDASPGKKRGEVIFDGMDANTQRSSQASRGSTRSTTISSAEKARRAERQMLQEIESGRYTPSLLHSRENTRLLGTVRNKPGPPVLPNIPPSQAPQGHQSPESTTPRRSSSHDDELRRSLEDGRNMLTQRSNAKRAPLPTRGRLSKTTPISTSDRTQQNSDVSASAGRRTHRRTGSDPFSTNFDEFASTLENIIRSRGRSVSVTAEMSSMSQHMSPLRTPLERETTMCLSIPTTIPESASPRSLVETSTTSAPGNSTVPTQMMALPPTSSRILPPTPTFLTQSSYTNLDQVLSKIPRDDGSSSSKEPSPRSDDEIPDNTFRVGLTNPMELLRSRSLLKEEFILADSRPRDPCMVSSGSDQTSSSSSLSTASSNSPREAGVGIGRAGYRRSDPSLLTVTLREKALKGAGFRKNDPSSVRKLEMPSSSGGGGGGDSGVSVGCSPSSSKAGASRDTSSAANSSGTDAPKAGEDVIVGKVGRSQSLRLTQRQQQSKQSPPNPANSGTGNMKRSQSIGSVPSAASTEQQKQPVAGQSSSTAGTQQKQGGSQQDLSKGAPFSGKGRMVIVRDSFEFDNVLTAGSKNSKKTPSPPSSSGPPQTSAKKSASHDKPELAYIKESTTLCERSRHNSSEQSVDNSRHQSETSRMSVSDVAISGVLQVDNSAAPDEAFSDDVSQQGQSSNAPDTRCSVPTSEPSNNSGKAGKGQTSVPSKPTSSQAKGGKNPVTSSASSKTVATSVDSRVAKIQQAIQNRSAVDSANMNVTKKEGVPPSPSTARTAPSPATTTANAPTSKPAVVNVPSTRPTVSKASSSVNSSTTTTMSKAVPKPVVSNTNQPVSSAASAVPAQKSSSEQAPPIRKSASAESISPKKQSGISAQGKQTSGEGGKKQNAALSSSVQKGLSASVRDISNRLSGSGTPVSRSNSNSSFTASRSTENSATTRSPAGSAAKNTASSRVITSSKQQSVLATKPSQTTTTTATPVSKSTTAPVNIAKVMQSLTKTTNSPRPSNSSTSKGPQETVSTNVSAAKPPINSASARAGKSQSTLSTDTTGAKPPSGSLTSRMQQGKTSSQQDLSKSGPTSSVNMPKAAFGSQKSDVKTSDAASSAKAVVKSPSDTVLNSKGAEDNAVESTEGKEPLVKITFGETKTKPGNVISKYCDPSVLNHTPVIVNPFENLTAYQTLKDKNGGEASAASDVCCVVGGKTEKDTMSVNRKGKGRQAKGSAKKVSSAKRPASGTSRQASAGKKGRGAKGKESKAGDAEDFAVPKSGKRVRSAKRRGKKAAEKELDKEAELLAQMAVKGDVALISGIGWHVAASCADTSDVIAATEMRMDSSSSDSEISDVESIEDAETLMKHLDVSKSNASLTSPRFREIKTEKEKSEAMKKIPAMISDGFPPMNLDMTQRDSLSLHPNVQVTEISDDNFVHDYDISDQSDSIDTQGINNELFLEMQMGKLTPIQEVLSVSVGPGSNVADAINRFDRSLKDNQLDYLLDGTPRNKASSAAGSQQTSASTSKKGHEKPPVPKDNSSKTAGKTNLTSKAPQIEVTAASSSSSKQSRGDAHPRRTQSLKEGKQSEKRERSRRERKFSESKREVNNEEEIEDAIEEILSATNTSMSSTLRSSASASSTLKSASNTLTEGDLHLLRRLKEHAKESPFHATKESSKDVHNGDDDDDDDDASTIIGEQSGSGSGECLGQETNPNLLKVMHAEQFDMGAKVKAMIDAGADKKKVKAMMKADEENPQLVAKQIVKVMNSFRHMELHAGHKEMPVSSESHKASKVTAAALDKVPLVRPSSAGAAKTKGRFHELKKGAAGGSNQQLAERKEGKSEDSEHEMVGAQGDTAEALAGDVARDVLANTAGSETMCSRLSRRSSRSGSASTYDSSVEETIQWKKGNILGKGAFGTVWCGLTNEGELIAVKQIDTTTDIRKAEREYEKVQEEVELLKTLNHINIVGYLGTSFEDGTVSIFMQFVPGGSIASILARFGALDEAVFRRYTRQILQGVQYLHENDVIHRDIKGGNVMLMPSGIIKLIDFGCAKRLCINLSLSQSQILRSMKGTPYWMAPEVVNESGHGKKSDIWSIGCTVFEMATMKPPWAEMNPMAAIFAIGSDKAVPQLPSKFSPEAIAFVNKCLTKDQQQRPSATELLTDAFMVEQPTKK